MHQPPHWIVTNPEGAAVERLLREAGLPASDITTAKLSHFFACRSDRELFAVVGLEVYGSVALLRSLSVAPSHRSRGVGAALVAHAEAAAGERGVTHLYLLTTTADSFFARLGYNAVPRAAAPHAIRETAEFTSLCPASSTLMMKQIAGAD